MDDSKKGILYLFDKPFDPVTSPKGEKQVVFEIPDKYYPNGIKPATTARLSYRIDEELGLKIVVKDMNLPDLSFPLQLGRREQFSMFIPRHRDMAASLVDTLMSTNECEDLLSLAVYCRDRMNPTMFFYALSTTMLHHPETKNLPLPYLPEVFPDMFMTSDIFSFAKEEIKKAVEGSSDPIEILKDYKTASDLDVEQRVAYFREDIGINLHHWHWHLVNPYQGQTKIVSKDRRGELFYYMHQQILARYNNERLCNRLERAERFQNWREPIPEGYFPKMNNQLSSKNRAGRQRGTILSDIRRADKQLNFAIQDMERWRDRIYDAIHSGRVITDKVMNDKEVTIALTEDEGIDILGNMVEASILSPNKNFYGNLHNSGHAVIALCHDPDNRYLEDFGVMGEDATAMRDPIFYRWHAFLDDIFQEHKNLMPAYPKDKLDFSNVRVTDIQVLTPNQPANTLFTFWQKSDIDISRGVDFLKSDSKTKIKVKITHLNHSPFTYRINVDNDERGARMGTVRIFIAPKQDERGVPYIFRNQRNLMIEMDKFSVKLQAGKNTFERKSTESSLTIPFERTFRDLNKDRPEERDLDTLEEFNFCGCGWPQHMLVPKGSKEGFPMELFVMVSDYTADLVEQVQQKDCKDASSFCGIRDEKYPDKRSMGYPFDRPPSEGVTTLKEFLTGNMARADISIRFDETIVPKNEAGTHENAVYS